jgi:hypothetical protein
MADDDDDVMESGEFEPEIEEEEVDIEAVDIDVDELDEADLEEDLEDEEFGGFEDDLADDGDDVPESDGPVRKSVSSEDEDEDDDIVAPDDVEADLDTILKDRLVATDDDGGNEDDEEPEDRSEAGDRLQPRRADEQLCSSCFLLVRQTAPMCPVGDDDCPIFISR